MKKWMALLLALALLPGGAAFALERADVYTLVAGEAGMTLTCVREAFTWPLGNLTMADFNGTWALAHMHLGADVHSAEALGMAVTLTLRDGMCHLSVRDAEGTVEYDMACALEEMGDSGTAMVFRHEGAEGQQIVPGVMLMLYGSDELVWNGYDGNGVYGYSICFVRAEAP